MASRLSLYNTFFGYDHDAFHMFLVSYIQYILYFYPLGPIFYGLGLFLSVHLDAYEYSIKINDESNDHGYHNVPVVDRQTLLYPNPSLLFHLVRVLRTVLCIEAQNYSSSSTEPYPLYQRGSDVALISSILRALARIVPADAFNQS